MSDEIQEESYTKESKDNFNTIDLSNYSGTGGVEGDGSEVNNFS
jgi:hypothetical protein